jgi:hypothetical protein
MSWFPPCSISLYSFKYQFPEVSRLKRFRSEYEEARNKDAQTLESKVILYTRLPQEVFRDLKIQPRAMLDALLAMQRVGLLTNTMGSPSSIKAYLMMSEYHSTPRQ